MTVPYIDGEPVVGHMEAYEAIPEYYDLFEEDDVKVVVHPYNPYLLELHHAVIHSNIHGLRVMLDMIARNIMDDVHIDEVTEKGETALHYACSFDDRACAKLLLERGASLEAKDDEGHTPLHKVCNQGSVKMMDLLLNSGRSRDFECVKRMVEAVDVNGETPLHLAARNGFLKCIKVLLRSGADPSKLNAKGQAPSEVTPLESEAAQFILSKA